MPCIYSLNSSKGRLFIPLRKETLLGGFPRCALLLSPHLPPPWNVCATPVLLLGPGLWHVSWCAQIQVCHRVRPLTPFPSSSAPSTRAEPESPGTCSCYLEHPYTVTRVSISRLPCALNFAPLILLIFPVESSKGLDLEDHRDTGGEGRGPAPGKATGKAGLDLVTHTPSSLSSGCRVDRTSACLLQCTNGAPLLRLSGDVVGWERACLARRKLRFHPLHQGESKLRRLRQEDCCSVLYRGRGHPGLY